MKKVLALLCLGLVTAFFAGCDSKNPASSTANDSIVFSNLAVTTVYAQTSAYATVSGTMTGTSTITNYTLTVHDRHGSDVSESFLLSDTVVQQKVVDLKVDAHAKICAHPGATFGKDYLIITASVGTRTIVDSVAFNVIGNLFIDSVVLGSLQGNSIDLDGPAVFTDLTSADNLSAIDLCYANSSGADSIPAGDYLFSPDKALANGYPFTTSWTGTPNTTAFYKLQNFTGAGFDTIYTKAQITALWTDPANPTPYASCAQGDVFIVKTDLGSYVLISITAKTPGSAGTVTIKIAE
jgi:hypothetical protein